MSVLSRVLVEPGAASGAQLVVSNQRPSLLICQDWLAACRGADVTSVMSVSEMKFLLILGFMVVWVLLDTLRESEANGRGEIAVAPRLDLGKYGLFVSFPWQ